MRILFPIGVYLVFTFVATEVSAQHRTAAKDSLLVYRSRGDTTSYMTTLATLSLEEWYRIADVYQQKEQVKRLRFHQCNKHTPVTIVNEIPLPVALPKPNVFRRLKKLFKN